MPMPNPFPMELLPDGSLSLKEKALHYISLFWKLLFALIPPTDYMNGWLTFFVAIFAIGVLTAIIGDVAALFGCTIGLKDSVRSLDGWKAQLNSFSR